MDPHNESISIRFEDLAKQLNLISWVSQTFMPKKARNLGSNDPKKAEIVNFWGPEVPNFQVAAL